MFGAIQDTDTNVPTDSSTQTFNIKDLPTKSVVLFPTRAHVTREINDVRLKPGANEVEIIGLSPTVDEQSIQIEGQGTATIIDMTVQLVPSRDIFEEAYPEDSSTSDDESEDEYQDSDNEEDAIRKLADELKDLRSELVKSTETQRSANERLATWDRYSKTANAEHVSPDEMSKLLQTYEKDRSKIFEVHSEASRKVTDLEKQIQRKEYEQLKAGEDVRKSKKKAEKEKAKERRKQAIRRAEKEQQAKYLKQERLRYWPKKVYKVTLLLESSQFDTPGPSRRNSLDSITLASTPRPSAEPTKLTDTESKTSYTPVSLLLSYVTKEAGWTPRYELRISSVQKTATIIYRTEFLNRTSETWKDTKLSFSTSQTSYQGLNDEVPFMHAWRVKLSRYHNANGLLSTEESIKPRSGRPGVDVFNRSDVFGLNDSFIPVWQSKRPLQLQQHSNPGGLFGQQHSNSAGGFGRSSSRSAAGGLFASSNASAGGGLFGQNNSSTAPFSSFGSQAPVAAPPPALLNAGETLESVEPRANAELATGIQAARVGQVRGMSLFRARAEKRSSKAGDQSENYDATIEETEERPETIDFEETSWEDNGLTATYDVPGTRTLAPSSLTRRHKIATLHAANIHLSHICVPKLRSAAFLRAKIRNPSSSVTLLKGSAGVTLDGSFLGNMDLPRVSPGQVFDLPLGVDPAIHVNYPKPSVHRSTQGIIFNKESAEVFTRSIWLNNTKSQLVDLLVLDQVPVSEDERLRIGIITPRGLTKDGNEVRAGVSAKEGSSGTMGESQKGKSSENWGSAMAKLKKGGEISWTVKLEARKGALLKLEYEARLPSEEKIVPA
jgi:hypothetical protein